jgi:hypothetical protein
MGKWKAKNASHFPTPPTKATGHIYHRLRYTNNLAGTKDRAGQGYMAFITQFTDNPADPGTGGSELATLLTGQPNSGGIYSIEHGAYFRHTVSLFVQDDWRVTRALSVNLGLRYDFFPPVRERSNGQSNFNQITGYLDIPKDSKATLPASLAFIPVNHNASNELIDSDPRNISPRVGFSYQINPRLVAESAFGVFFNSDESGIWGGNGINPAFLSSPVYVAKCNLPSYNAAVQDCSIPSRGVLSQGFPANALSNPNTPNMLSYQMNLSTPYVMQWHLAFQYQVELKTALEIAYAGSKGNKEYIFYNLNQASPTADPTAPYAPRRSFPYVNAPIWETSSEGNSNYNALQTSMAHRLSHGLSALVNYTYSKSHGNASTTMGSQNNDSFRWSKEPHIEYGPLDFDVRNQFVANFIYALPFGRGEHFGNSVSSMIDKVIGHWTATGIVSLSSGTWFAVTDADENFANSDGQQRPNFIPGQKATSKPCVAGTFFNTCAFADPPLGSFGNVSLNSLEGPGDKNVDLALQKIVPIHDSVHLELRAETFTAFNHLNFLFAAPGPQNSNSSTVLGAPSFGYVTAAEAPREFQLAAKFNF